MFGYASAISRKGVLDDKDVEKYLKELPDSAANVENVTLAQPAISGAVRPVAPASVSGIPPVAIPET